MATNYKCGGIMSRNNDLNNEYIYRINKVLDYIELNLTNKN